MSATGRGRQRIAGDAYYTPYDVIYAIANIIEDGPTDIFNRSYYRVMDPCPGDGRILDIMAQKQWFVFEPKDCWSYINTTNYLDARLSLNKDEPKFDLILTNPPFKSAERIVRKALTQAYVVIALARLDFLGSIIRIPFWKHNPVHSIYVIVPRPSFAFKGTDSCEYAWFIWKERPHSWLQSGKYFLYTGGTGIHHLDTRPYRGKEPKKRKTAEVSLLS